MKVMKFGGSSVGGIEQVRKTCDLIARRARPGDIIIESAVGVDLKNNKNEKVTDMLIRICKTKPSSERLHSFDELKNRHYEIIDALGIDRQTIASELKELEALLPLFDQSKKALDLFQSFGERMSVNIVAAELRAIGVEATAYDAFEVGMMTDSNYGSAVPMHDAYPRIQAAMKSVNHIAVVTGFIGKDIDGNITTLGRGGSDYSAAIFAAAVGADSIELWTDVNGIKSAHPKIVPEAHTIRHMSYDEAKELSFYGAKLHPKTIWPAMEKNIPVHIMNTFDPEGEFTIITHEKKVQRAVMKGITCDKGNYIVSMSSPRMIGQSGFLARILDAFEINRTDIDMVSTSESSVSLTINDSKMIKAILDELKGLDETMEVKVDENKSIICIVGEGMKHVSGTSGRIFSALGKAGISIEAISQGASEINITFIVDDKDADKAVKAVHDEFFRSKSDYMDEEEEQ